MAVVKTMLDFDFGAAITNRPYYTASRKKKVEHIKKVFPDGRRVIMLEQIYNGAFITHDQLKELTASLIVAAEATTAKLLKLETSLRGNKTAS